MWLFNPDEAQGVLNISGATEWVGLAELGDASHFDNWRFLLPLCKAIGLVTIRVDANKSFAIRVTRQ